jgi:hypothetical protein
MTALKRSCTETVVHTRGLSMVCAGCEHRNFVAVDGLSECHVNWHSYVDRFGFTVNDVGHDHQAAAVVVVELHHRDDVGQVLGEAWCVVSVDGAVRKNGPVSHFLGAEFE